MRPTSADLLRSARRSLVDVVIPNVDDDWARYVAKGMDKILEHVELRCRLEHDLLVQDTRELRSLFAELADELDRLGPSTGPATGLAELSTRLRSCLGEEALVDGPVAAPEELLVENETHRAHVVAAIEALDAAGRRDPELDRAVRPLQARVRALVRRELDRDLQLASPTFMLFGPPPKAIVKEGSATA